MTDSPESHDPVRRLLALKRHEVPPPGYFDRFSSEVLHRIEQERQAAATPWWQGVFASLNWQRTLAAANLAALAGMAIIGFTVVNLAGDDEPAGPEHFAALALPQPANPGLLLGSPLPAQALGALYVPASNGNQPFEVLPAAFQTPSEGTNGESAPPGLFSTPRLQNLQPVSEPRFSFPRE